MYDIIAKVTLLSTNGGGRQGPTPTSVFGCPLEIEDKYFDCRLDLSEAGPLSPGDTATAPISFLYPKLALPLLKVGSNFSLWEGGTIGHGIVVDVETQTYQGAATNP